MHLRQIDAELPILIFTGESLTDDLVDALEGEGATAVLSKEIPQLIAHIEHLATPFQPADPKLLPDDENARNSWCK
jgi:hypothetical protein